SAAIFDLMTAYTIVLLHQAASLDDLLDAQPLVGQISLANMTFAETAQQNPQRLDILIGQIELRHQLLDALGRIAPRSFEFVVSPIVPCIFDIGPIAERKLFDGF